MSLSPVRAPSTLTPALLEWRDAPREALQPGETFRAVLRIILVATAGIHDLSLRLEREDGSILLSESLLSELLGSRPGELSLRGSADLSVALPLPLAPGHYRLTAELLGGREADAAPRCDCSFRVRPGSGPRVRGLLALPPAISLAELGEDSALRAAGAAFPTRVNFADPAFAPHLRGFHAAEHSDAGGYRWTAGEARFPLRLEQPSIRFRILATSPAADPIPRRLQLWLDGEPAGEKLLAPGEQEAVFSITPNFASGRVVTVTLRVPEWTPAELLTENTDRRSLGIALQSAESAS